MQVSGGTQAPQVPSHPSGPHWWPEHWGWQDPATHWPDPSHCIPSVQDPHDPLQPSLPQALPVQEGWQVPVTQVPRGEHVVLPVQVPQEPLQPSSPHCLPVQAGVQVLAAHWPLVWPARPAWRPDFFLGDSWPEWRGQGL